MHEQHLTVPGVPLTVPNLGGSDVQMEPRLAVLLARAVPEQVNNEARAIHKGIGTTIGFRTQPFRSLSTLLAAYDFASPGGME